MPAIVTGIISTYHVGGGVWDYGQYAVGPERLGFEEYYLEGTGGMTYNPQLPRYVEDPSFGDEYLRQSLECILKAADMRFVNSGMHPNNAHALFLPRCA